MRGVFFWSRVTPVRAQLSAARWIRGEYAPGAPKGTSKDAPPPPPAPSRELAAPWAAAGATGATRWSWVWVPASGRWGWFSVVVGSCTVAHGWVGLSVCPPGLGLVLGWARWNRAPGLCNSWSLFLPNSNRQRFGCGWRDVESAGPKDCAEVRSGPFALGLHLHLLFCTGIREGAKRVFRQGEAGL